MQLIKLFGLLSLFTVASSQYSWVRYDLTIPASETIPPYNESDIQERAQVGVYEIAGMLSSCANLISKVYDWAGFWGSLIKAWADGKSCGVHHGREGGLCWRYQATGGKCDTTAEEKTLQGAILHHLTQDPEWHCHQQCLNLRHQRELNFDGYLMIGPCKIWDPDMYCGPTLDFGQCTKGGKKDFISFERDGL